MDFLHQEQKGPEAVTPCRSQSNQTLIFFVSPFSVKLECLLDKKKGLSP